MNVELINSIAQIVMFGFGIVFILFMAIFLSVSIFCNKRATRNYKKSVVAVFEYHAVKRKKDLFGAIDSLYDDYRKKRLSFGWQNKGDLNKELLGEITRGKHIAYYKGSVSSADLSEMLESVIHDIERKEGLGDEQADILFDELKQFCAMANAELFTKTRELYLIRTASLQGEAKSLKYVLRSQEEKYEKKLKYKKAWQFFAAITGLASLASFVLFFI